MWTGHEIHFTSSPSAFKSSKKETPTHIAKYFDTPKPFKADAAPQTLAFLFLGHRLAFCEVMKVIISSIVYFVLS